MHLDPALRDYGYIEYFQKSIPDEPVQDSLKEAALCQIKFEESQRDYFTASLRQVNA